MSFSSPAATAGAYWASHFFGCPLSALFGGEVLNHGGELSDYAGAFALFREGGWTVSAPPDHREEVEALLAASGWLSDPSPQSFALALAPVTERAIGPAFVGYAEVMAAPRHAVRTLEAADASAVEALQTVCDPVEWDHGGSSLEQPCSGVFAGGRLVALAGYEVWGGAIAHLSIVSDPAFRGRGYGTAAVAHLATQALAAGLLPQYRTLMANRASMRVGEALGFQPYAVSMAVRFSEK